MEGRPYASERKGRALSTQAGQVRRTRSVPTCVPAFSSTCAGTQGFSHRLSCMRARGMAKQWETHAHTRVHAHTQARTRTHTHTRAMKVIPAAPSRKTRGVLSSRGAVERVFIRVGGKAGQPSLTHFLHTFTREVQARSPHKRDAGRPESEKEKPEWLWAAKGRHLGSRPTTRQTCLRE